MRGGAFRCLLWRCDPEAPLLSRLLALAGWLLLGFFFSFFTSSFASLVENLEIGSALLQLRGESRFSLLGSSKFI
jgi:hypothetical protein